MYKTKPMINHFANSLLEDGHTVSLKVTGASMRPWLHDGDTAIIRKVSPEDIDKGNLILFITDEQRLVIHRVVRIKQSNDGPLFFTKGDANLHYDPLLTNSKILGKVISVRYRGKTQEKNLEHPWERCKAKVIAYFSISSRYTYPLVYPVWKQVRGVVQPFLR